VEKEKRKNSARRMEFLPFADKYECIHNFQLLELVEGLGECRESFVVFERVNEDFLMGRKTNGGVREL
jgi:hypothetical protein